MPTQNLNIVDNIENLQLDPAQQVELNTLLNECHEYLDSCDDDLIIKAFKLSFFSHEGITRASGEPYYLHPL